MRKSLRSCSTKLCSLAFLLEQAGVVWWAQSFSCFRRQNEAALSLRLLGKAILGGRLQSPEERVIKRVGVNRSAWSCFITCPVPCSLGKSSQVAAGLAGPCPLIWVCPNGPGALFLYYALLSSHSLELSSYMPVAAFDASLPSPGLSVGQALWFATFPCFFSYIFDGTRKLLVVSLFAFHSLWGCVWCARKIALWLFWVLFSSKLNI